MNSTFEVTAITNLDLEQVFDLAQRSKLSYWHIKDYQEELNHPNSIFYKLTYNKNSFAGFLVARLIPGQINMYDAELFNIAVEPVYKRCGGANKLMKKFINSCRSFNVGNIWLDVRVNNRPAVLLYENLGFKAVSLRKSYYVEPVEDALVMNLSL